MQPGSLGGMVLAHGLGPASKACILRNDPGCPQSPLGQFPGVWRLVPLRLLRPHQQKQSHSHQNGAATHACQAQEMEGPAPSPFHQEHLQRESGLARGLQSLGCGRGWMGGSAKGWTFGTPRYVMVGTLPEASSYRDQGEDCVDHAGSDGGIGWFLYPR